MLESLPKATPEPINRADELSDVIQMTIGEYIKVCPEPIDFFDIIEALALAGVRELYQDAVLHPQPIFTDQEFKMTAELVSDVITKALSDRPEPLTPVVELIGIMANLAHLSHTHNEKMKAYIQTLDLASSEASAASEAPLEN